MRRVLFSAAFAISTLTACIYLEQPAYACDYQPCAVDNSGFGYQATTPADTDFGARVPDYSNVYEPQRDMNPNNDDR